MKNTVSRISRILPNLILLLFPWSSLILMHFASDFLYQARKHIHPPSFFVVYLLFLLVLLAVVYGFLCKAVPVSRICVVVGIIELIPLHFVKFCTAISSKLYQTVFGCYPSSFLWLDVLIVLYIAILLAQFRPRR